MKFAGLRSLPLLFLLLFAPQAAFGDELENGASTDENSTDAAVPEQSDSEIAADLHIERRANIEYHSSGGGFDGLASFTGFLPFHQELGRNIAFIETDFSFDNDLKIGGSFLVGGRVYSPERNRILGAYVGFDSRTTDENAFYQLGAGLERLGYWDLRINGFLPIGRTNQISNEFTSTQTVSANAEFSRRRLLVNSVQETRRLTEREVALAGLDLEMGLELLRWEGGDFRANAGTYLYTGDDIDTHLGWRVRLDANVNPHTNLSLGLQDDGLFGTNILAAVNFSFPSGLRPDRELDDEEAVMARLGDPVERISTVLLTDLREVEIDRQEFSAVLFNPEEEQPYTFTHVDLSKGSGGNGTFENPFGTVQDALDATVRDGNDIVYVDAEGSPRTRIASFRIPDRVRVLSQGPRQQIAGLTPNQAIPGFPEQRVRLPFTSVRTDTALLVELPFSGDGVFPIIEGGGGDAVTLGNNTVLAGFDIRNAAGNGVAGTNVENVELRNNVIRNSRDSGIALNNVGGSVILYDQAVSNSGDRGILVSNSDLLQSLDMSISGFQLENNRVGLEISIDTISEQLVDIGPSSDINTSIGLPNGVTINNEITGSAGEGVLLTASNLGSQSITLDQATVRRNGLVTNAPAISLEIEPLGFQEFTVRDSVISDNRGSGISAIATGNDVTGLTQEVNIIDNVIANNQGDGIIIEGSGITFQGFSIFDNDILNNRGAAIISTGSDVSRQEFAPNASVGTTSGIGMNLISGNGAGIILTTTSESDSSILANIENNTIRNNSSEPGIQVTQALGDVTDTSSCVYIFGNTVPTGIEINNLDNLFFEVLDPNGTGGGPNAGSLASNNNGSTFTLNGAGFVEEIGSTCF